MLVFAVGAALLCAAQTAEAGTLKLDAPAHGKSDIGGEYLVTEYDYYYMPPAAKVMQQQGDTDFKDFLTFCVEYNEGAPIPNEFDYSVDLEMIAGGNGGGDGNSDDISEDLAQLFYAYWTGQLNDFGADLFDYDDTGDVGLRAADAKQLQFAIWDLADEIVIGDLGRTSLADDFVDLAEDLTWADLGQDGWKGQGDVMALNLYATSDGSNRQSMLIVVPLPSSAYMGMALLGGLAVCALVRRRRRLHEVA